MRVLEGSYRPGRCLGLESLGDVRKQWLAFVLVCLSLGRLYWYSLDNLESVTLSGSHCASTLPAAPSFPEPVSSSCISVSNFLHSPELLLHPSLKLPTRIHVVLTLCVGGSSCYAESFQLIKSEFRLFQNVLQSVIHGSVMHSLKKTKNLLCFSESIR